MKPLDLWQLELAFDGGKREAIQGLEGGAAPTWNLLQKMLLAIDAENFPKVFTTAEELLALPLDADSFGFVLQYAVGSTEILYDLALRKEWLDRWKEMPEALTSEYCLYIRIVQAALGSFFQGQIREAERLFEQSLQIARTLGYPRGEMRSLFHLALVAKERGFGEKSNSLLKKSAEIAIQLGAERFSKRIREELSQQDISSFHAEMRMWLAIRDWKRARALYLRAEAARRASGRHRGAESNYRYLAILCLAFQKPARYQFVKGKIQDPVILEEVLATKAKLFQLSRDESSELRYLRMTIGKANIISDFTAAADHELLGIRINSLTKQDVQKFVRLLIEANAAVSKDVICERLWNLRYTPTAHDGRLYKLVHHTRRIFQKSDVILNSYGSYRLNPVYLGQADLVS